MSDLAPRPRSATEIVDAAFQLYRRNPLQLMLVTAIVYAPLLVINLTVMSATGFGSPTFKPTLAAMGPVVLLGVASLVVYSIVDAATAKMASELYFGRDCDAWEALREVGHRLVSVIPAVIIESIAFLLGAIFLVAPMFYLIARFFAVVPAIVIEGVSAPRAFGRSSALSVGLKWHILGTLILAFFIFMAVSWGTAIVTLSLHIVVIQQVVATAVTIVLYPLVGLARTILYYDSRIRVEGYDIEMMAAMSGAPTVPSPQPV